MSLDVYCITNSIVFLSSEYVIESYLVKSRTRCVSGYVPSDTVQSPVGIGHHDCSIPKYVVLDLFLYLHISGVWQLLIY